MQQAPTSMPHQQVPTNIQYQQQHQQAPTNIQYQQVPVLQYQQHHQQAPTNIQLQQAPVLQYQQHPQQPPTNIQLQQAPVLQYQQHAQQPPTNIQYQQHHQQASVLQYQQQHQQPPTNIQYQQAPANLVPHSSYAAPPNVIAANTTKPEYIVHDYKDVKGLIFREIYREKGYEGWVKYFNTVRSFILGEISRKELETVIRAHLAPDKIFLHNKFMLLILHNISAPTSTARTGEAGLTSNL